MTAAPTETDVLVVGGGMGGIYAVKRFRDAGHSVVALEAAAGLGGVWYHNAYPGARVDVESVYYCYHFDPELFREWRWTERFSAQPELLAYLNHVADRYDVRRHYRMSTRLTGARWDPATDRWLAATSAGEEIAARYLVMATGQYSTTKLPNIPGLEDFAGEIVQSSAYRPVGIDDRRVAVIGTGSSGVQVATAVSATAAHTYVIQRTPSWIIPAYNGPSTPEDFAAVDDRVAEVFEALLGTSGGASLDRESLGRSTDFTPEERDEIMERRWAENPVRIFFAFSDIATSADGAEIMADFVRKKVRQIILDPEVAEALLAVPYPIGTRRIVREMGYFDALNRDDVTLVDVRTDPIDRITPAGMRLASGREIELDTIVLALGFDVYFGALRDAPLRDADGRDLLEKWARGPRTYLGTMTHGYPNLFLITGPGSPSILTNMNVHNVQHIDFVAELVAFAEAQGATRIEPTVEAEDAWTAHVAEAAVGTPRASDDGFMVQVLDDGTKVVLPYVAGLDVFTRECRAVAAAGFEGFELSGGSTG